MAGGWVSLQGPSCTNQQVRCGHSCWVASCTHLFTLVLTDDLL
jgi:hypothetical protein